MGQKKGHGGLPYESNVALRGAVGSVFEETTCLSEENQTMSAIITMPSKIKPAILATIIAARGPQQTMQIRREAPRSAQERLWETTFSRGQFFFALSLSALLFLGCIHIHPCCLAPLDVNGGGTRSEFCVTNSDA